MRNEPLTAYSLHQRNLKDKRNIYYLFSKEHGILHGVAKKGIPQFVPLTLFTTGKKSLKTFNQVAIVGNTPYLSGQQQYAALYVNEITIKLLPIEDSVPNLYAQYEQVIKKLHEPMSNHDLKLALRLYEQALFQELGYAIDLEQDENQQPIDANEFYYFGAERGWYKRSDKSTQNLTSNSNLINKPYKIQGIQIIELRSGIDINTIKTCSLIHRQLIDHLFDHQPLQSRILWQQYMQYQ